MKRKTWLWLSLAAALAWPAVRLPAAELDASVVPLLKRSYFYGREYFVLRSGRAKMIVQADKADLAPAFMYLLFDAEDSGQTKRKEQAFNFAEGQGMANSALEVVLGGFPFTALGHETENPLDRRLWHPRRRGRVVGRGAARHGTHLRLDGRERLHAGGHAHLCQPGGTRASDATAIASARSLYD